MSCVGTGGTGGPGYAGGRSSGGASGGCVESIIYVHTLYKATTSPNTDSLNRETSSNAKCYINSFF